MATERDEEIHRLVRNVNHGEGQLEAARNRLLVNRAENPEWIRSSEMEVRNAERFIAHARAELRSRYGVTDVEAETNRLLRSGQSFRDKGSVNATGYQG